MRAFFALAGLPLAVLMLAGCSLGTDQLTPPPLAAAEPPDLTRLAAKIQDTFKAMKLSGYPRVSRPRRAPISAFGDWIVCLRSDAENSGIYALFISGSEIVDYRLALMIDDCAKESFAPLPAAPLTK
jgi:hypothetical protein